MSTNPSRTDGANRPESGRRHPYPQHGFTLFEIILSLVILGLLTGSVFHVVGSSMSASDSVKQIQIETAQVQSLYTNLRRVFQALPETAQISLLIVEEGEAFPLQEFTISNATTQFAWGAYPVSYAETTFRNLYTHTETIDQGEDSYETDIYAFALSRPDLVDELTQTDGDEEILAESLGVPIDFTPDVEGRYWISLMPDLTGITWQCLDGETNEWFDEWDREDWPAAIATEIHFPGAEGSQRLFFKLSEPGEAL